MMAEGNFHDALGIYDAKGAINWTRTQGEARKALVDQWAKDSAARPDKARFVFAYTNDDVSELNQAIRAVRKERGELEWENHAFVTKHGVAEFSAGDRVQFTGTDKKKGLINGVAGTIHDIDDNVITVRLDGKNPAYVTFDANEFQDFRHGYAGTIYKGQGRTLDETYLYHSEHWRSASSYVALTRHRDKTELFVARNTAEDVTELARQMGRVDDRRAASQFVCDGDLAPVRRLSPIEIMARFGDISIQRPAEQARAEETVRAAQQQSSADQPEEGRSDEQANIDNAFAGVEMTEGREAQYSRASAGASRSGGRGSSSGGGGRSRTR